MKNIILIMIFFISGIICVKAHTWDKDKRKWTPLMHAVYRGNINQVNQILLTDSSTINTIIKYPYLTAMQIAIRKNRLEIINILFKNLKYISLDKLNIGSSEIFEACIYGKIDVIKYFLTNGVDINNKVRSSDTLYLINIISHRSTKDLLFFINNGANINIIASNSYLCTALHGYAFNGNLKGVKILLEHGADKSIKNKEGKRAYDMVDEIYPYLHISKRKKAKLKKLLE